jgi:phosphatidylinositol glycan class O
MVLEEKSSCADPPIAVGASFKGVGTPGAGCWHPKSFDKAVVIVIDALRYDFTIPYINTTDAPSQAYHNALPVLYETAVREPHNAFLLPFIADPPTTTLQRLKGLTTGTLPTFVDMGSNFAGTAIEEDNLLMQMKDAGKRIVHLGDDTWTALFPGYFEEGISRAYDSLNVWDLHTVDNGVTEHIFPLLGKEKKGLWDVTFAHYLGVDHAGHRYGPNHPAMTAKLTQMNELIGQLLQKLDDDTLLVIMGDHGMDGKGDHGGESDDEVQAALWMYSKKGIFGRTDPAFITPPPTAKERPVNQIDLVPTLALLLGLPIPFNNLGKPIEEAFVGRKGNAWENLASVARMTAAGIKRYQAAYYSVGGIDESVVEGSPYALWAEAEKALTGSKKQEMWKDGYIAYSAFQGEVLRICRGLWARFDVPCILLGIGILAGGVIALLLFANSNAQEGDAVDDAELDRVELQREIDNFVKEEKTKLPDETTSRILVRGALMGSLMGTALGPALWIVTGGDHSILDFGLAVGSVTGVLGVLYQEMRRRMEFSSPFPTTFWGWLAVIFTLCQSIGFASNSYTIWEDSMTLYFISTFGAAALITSMRIENEQDRALGVYHSIAFVALGWLASFSKLCREEQMPYCRSTYYASATSSTSAPWQLLIPFIIAAVLPMVIKSFYSGSRSYEGFAPIWIGWVFRLGLLSSAIFWTLDAADDGEWFPNLPTGLLKNIRVPIAQTIFAIAVGAGTTAFHYAPPCVSISTTASPGGHTINNAGTTVTILGFANTHGTRYFLLVTNILLPLLLVQKPMGAGALSLMAWQILSLLEILDLNALTSSPIGPVVLALLGSFHFFKTGHQATLASIQWESAFIPLHTIRYPWSPILVALNTFGSHILAVSSIPLIVLWKQKPRKKHILQSTAVALAWFLAYHAVIGLATTMWAGHLRRHLMLYRIFSPKFMTAAFVCLVVDLVGVIVALGGARLNTESVGDVFGWG